MINNDNVAALRMSRFSKAAAMVPYSVYRLTAYGCTKGEAAACDSALADFKANVDVALKHVDGAMSLDPDQGTHAAPMAEFRSRFVALVAEVQAAADLGLKDDDSGLTILKSVDPKFHKLNEDITAFNDKAIAENKVQAQEIMGRRPMDQPGPARHRLQRGAVRARFLDMAVGQPGLSAAGATRHDDARSRGRQPHRRGCGSVPCR